MLKTNSKKARENIRAYIMNNQNISEFGSAGKAPGCFQEAAREILSNFRKTHFLTENDKRYFGNSEETAFKSWTQGLPAILNTEYYLHSAVDDLGAILDETEAEKAKYTQEEAEKLLTYLIYKELINGEKEN